MVITRSGNGLTPIGAVGNEPRYKGYEPGVPRVREMAKVRPLNWSTSFQQDSTWQWYDGPGNLLGSRSYSAAAQSESQSKHFYGADDRLRVVQRVAVRNEGESFNQKHSGVWEEYRYDPLGRRIMVRTRTDAGLCDVDPWTCTGSITRFVWAGDQILWELKAPGNDGANLEATTGSGNAYGQVSYTHAGGIDRPLIITKNGVSVIPHQNWRGMLALGTNPAGGLDVPDIDWPGYHTTPWHGPTRVVENWFGSLSTEMRDATGQLYKRNRYYDPASGQFTQPDPIGLAGGLNSYGFAEGDPVSYSDPYGLCAFGIGPDAAYGRCGNVQADCRPRCPEPASGPSVAPPPGRSGQPNGWVRRPPRAPGRRAPWVPREPVPGQSQPGASWDPRGNHWDVDDGLGNRRRYAPDGTEVDHDGNPLPGNTQESLLACAPPMSVCILNVPEATRRLMNWLSRLPSPTPAAVPPLPGLTPLPVPE